MEVVPLVTPVDAMPTDVMPRVVVLPAVPVVPVLFPPVVPVVPVVPTFPGLAVVVDVAVAALLVAGSPPDVAPTP